MFNLVKWYKNLEWLSLILALVSVLFLFVNWVLSVLFAGLGEVAASMAVLMYLYKPKEISFSGRVLWGLFFSSFTILILFFKMLKS